MKYIKMKKQSEVICIGLTAVFATILALYASEQQKVNAQEERAEIRAYASTQTVCVVEVPTMEEVPEEEPENISLGEFKLTAYCSCEKCCGQWSLNRPVDESGNQIVIGASGEQLIEGVSIAVDKEVIPYGTTVLINGKEYIAHDCGGALKKKKNDVYTSSHESALEFGVQYAEVFVKGSEK